MARLPRFRQDEVVALRDQALVLVRGAFNIRRDDLKVGARCRCGKAEVFMRTGKVGPTFARHIAIYLVRIYGPSLAQCAAAFGFQSLHAISNACARVEDARDDAGLDAHLDALEITLRRRHLKGRNTDGVAVQDRPNFL